MDEIRVRKASIQDLDTLLHFEQELIEAELPFDITLKDPPNTYYDLKDLMARDDAELAVAEINGELVASGYAKIVNSKTFLKHKQHVYLGFMFVSPAHRGKGINRLIINFLIQWASAKNISELRLDVYAGNFSAIRAYEKLGFGKHMIEMRLDFRKDQL